MNDSNMQIILDALAETIKDLKSENYLLKYENERLKESLKIRPSEDVCKEGSHA